MKFIRFIFCTAVVVLVSGCGHLEIKPESNPDRVVSGVVRFQTPMDLPEGARVTVRLLDATSPGTTPVVLGEQSIADSRTPPIPFRIEYRADEARLRLGLNLEARVSVAGKLRFYNIDSYTVTTSDESDPHEIWVVPTGR
jgi:uncharacterized lipoprotein YbaY